MVFSLHGDLSFLLHYFFLIQIVPFKLEKLKMIKSREKKDMIKSGNKTRYSMMQIMTLKATIRETSWINIV